MNHLEQLKKLTKVVADSGDFESIRKFRPVDATTNPSLILIAARDPKYSALVDDAIEFAKHQSGNEQEKINLAMDRLIIGFGKEILRIVPGRVSTETDARLSFDTEGTIRKARELISLYQHEGIDRKNILIKIASTWEGIKAGEQLTREGIHCNMTLLFSLPQAVACAEAGIQLISPFVGRILDWYKKNQGIQHIPPEEEPGVLLVQNIYNYYKKFGYKTEIMGASFRNAGEIIALAGCDLLTISPELLKELEQAEGTLERKLYPEKAKVSEIKRLDLDEKKFRWMMNEDAMATEKLSEGIRKFTEDILKLENLIANRI